jgi:putative PIN family toxin of toxin-antitoxin system
MISAVFDCVVYVQAALSRKGPAFACLQLAEAEYVTLYVSDQILDEIRRALSYPSLRQRYTRITDETVSQFLEHLEKISVITQNPATVFSLRRDPKDEPYINLAVETAATFIVSRDADLLDLMKNEQFRKTYLGITILDPVAFLRHVRAQVAKELGYP